VRGVERLRGRGRFAVHRSESRELTLCAVCGAEIRVAGDRAYAFGADGALCHACAVARGGVYDEQRDRWLQDADTSDLEREER